MKQIRVYVDVRQGEMLAKQTDAGWAYRGEHFEKLEGDGFISREGFVSGETRYTWNGFDGWGVIRGSEVIPFSV